LNQNKKERKNAGQEISKPDGINFLAANSNIVLVIKPQNRTKFQRKIQF